MGFGVWGAATLGFEFGVCGLGFGVCGLRSGGCLAIKVDLGLVDAVGCWVHACGFVGWVSGFMVSLVGFQGWC